MIVTQKENTIQTSGIKLTKEMGISQDGMGFIQNILRSQIYSCKISAVVREIAVNAIDSHAEAGCPERPIVVTLPSRFNSTFKVRDFGTGMSEDTILNLYAYFGSSSKRETNLQAGFLGIGKVSPLSYGESFILCSFFNSVKNTYNIYVDSNNLSQIAKLASEPTAEENGVEIQVSVKDHDISAFHDKALKIFSYFKVHPIVNGATLDYSEKDPILKGNGWSIYRGESQSIAIMGSIAYPIADHFDDRNISNVLSCGIRINFEIGEISVSASRESLEYNSRTKKVILDKLKVIVAEVADELNKRFVNCSTKFDAHKLYGAVMDYSSDLYVLKGLLKNKIQFNGKLIEGSEIYFNRPPNFAWDLKEYESSWRSKRVKAYSYNKIQCSENTVLVDNDLNRQSIATNRVRDLVKVKSKKVYVLNYASAVEKQKFFDETGLVQSNFILLSSLPKTTLISSATATPKNVKHSSKEFSLDLLFQGKNGWRSQRFSDLWTQESIDIKNDSGIYVIIDCFRFKDKNGYLQDPKLLLSLVNSLRTAGLNIPKVYGFKIAKKSAVEKNPNMVLLWDYLAVKLPEFFVANNVSQKIANRLSYDQNITHSWTKFMLENGDKVSQKTVLAKAAKIFSYMKHSADGLILKVAVNFKDYFTPTSKPEYELELLAAEVDQTYPMFDLVFHWNGGKSQDSVIIGYVNLVDGGI